MLFKLCIFYLFWLPMLAWASTNGCQPSASGVQIQVLGSGGPELGDQRASSSYLIWHDGVAKLLVDIGSGSLLRLEQTPAKINTIEAILLSHLHVDHTADLPAFIKASFFSDRNTPLKFYGPSANRLMPDTETFVDRLFGKDGAYRYLSSYLDGADSYQLQAFNLPVNLTEPMAVMETPSYQVSAVSVQHGPIPALAWQVNIGGKKLVFSGDMNHNSKQLNTLAKAADILVAHHAVSESATGVARDLHMPPSVIGALAAKARVKQLVLSHHMQRTLHQFEQSKQLIRAHYTGPLYFANDLSCYYAD